MNYTKCAIYYDEKQASNDCWYIEARVAMEEESAKGAAKEVVNRTKHQVDGERRHWGLFSPFLQARAESTRLPQNRSMTRRMLLDLDKI